MELEHKKTCWRQTQLEDDPGSLTKFLGYTIQEVEGIVCHRASQLPTQHHLSPNSLISAWQRDRPDKKFCDLLQDGIDGEELDMFVESFLHRAKEILESTFFDLGKDRVTLLYLGPETDKELRKQTFQGYTTPPKFRTPTLSKVKIVIKKVDRSQFGNSIESRSERIHQVCKLNTHPEPYS